jgi:hypothetical protein
LTPDFKTIADFRKDNGEAIPRVCRPFVELSRQLGLLDEAVAAIDGGKSYRLRVPPNAPVRRRARRAVGSPRWARIAPPVREGDEAPRPLERGQAVRLSSHTGSCDRAKDAVISRARLPR